MLDGEPSDTGINIRTLTLSEVAPVKDKPFDPQRDLTQAHWDGIWDQFNKTKGGDAINVLRLAFAISLIDKSQVGKMDWNDDAIDDVQAYVLDDYRMDGLYVMYAEAAAEVVQLGLEDKFDIHFVNDERVWNAVKAEYEKYNPGDFFTHKLNPYTIAQILFPTRVHELPPLNDADFLSLLKRMTKHLEQSFRDNPTQRLSSLSEAYLQARLMRPEIDLTAAGVTNEYWRAMKEELPEPSYGFSLILDAAQMSVLAADRVRVSPQGIDVVYDRPDKEIKVALPVLKTTNNA